MLRMLLSSLVILAQMILSATITFAQINDLSFYSISGRVTVITELGDDLWVGMTNGAVRLNRQTGEMERFSTATSPLTENLISSIAIDGNENIWLGTPLGIARYDGVDWIRFDTAASGMALKDVRDITLDSAGVLWCVASQKLLRYDDSRWKLETEFTNDLPTWNIGNIAAAPDSSLWIVSTEAALFVNLKDTDWLGFTASISETPVLDAYDIAVTGDNHLWVSTLDGLVVYDGVEWSLERNAFDAPLGFGHIMVSANGKGWIEIRDTDSVLQYNGLDWTTIKISDAGLINATFGAAYTDVSGKDWIGNTVGELACFDGNEWTQTTLAETMLLSNFSFAKIGFDGNGNTWVATRLGIGKFDGQSWTTFTTENSPLRFNNIFAMEVDSEDNVWFGLPFGVDKFDGVSWTQFDEDDIPSVSVSTIRFMAVDSSGGIWVALGGGILTRYDGEQWERVAAPENVTSQCGFTSLTCAADGTVWLASECGLFSRAEAEWTRYDTTNSELPKNKITALEPDREGGVWVGTGDGLAHFNGTVWETFTSENSSLLGNHIAEIAIDSNNDVLLYISSFNISGLVGKQQQEWVLLDSLNSRIPGHGFWDMKFDNKGSLWIATDAGVSRYSGDLPTSVDEPGAYRPLRNAAMISLSQNVPNPFASFTAISYGISKEIGAVPVSLCVFDVLGNNVATLVDERKTPGVYETTLRADNLLNGVYWCRLQAGAHTQSRLMIIQRP